MKVKAFKARNDARNKTRSPARRTVLPTKQRSEPATASMPALSCTFEFGIQKDIKRNYKAASSQGDAPGLRSAAAEHRTSLLLDAKGRSKPAWGTLLETRAENSTAKWPNPCTCLASSALRWSPCDAWKCAQQLHVAVANSLPGLSLLLALWVAGDQACQPQVVHRMQ